MDGLDNASRGYPNLADPTLNTLPLITNYESNGFSNGFSNGLSNEPSLLQPLDHGIAATAAPSMQHPTLITDINANSFVIPPSTESDQTAGKRSRQDDQPLDLEAKRLRAANGPRARLAAAKLAKSAQRPPKPRKKKQGSDDEDEVNFDDLNKEEESESSESDAEMELDPDDEEIVRPKKPRPGVIGRPRKADISAAVEQSVASILQSAPPPPRSKKGRAKQSSPSDSPREFTSSGRVVKKRFNAGADEYNSDDDIIPEDSAAADSGTGPGTATGTAAASGADTPADEPDDGIPDSVDGHELDLDQALLARSKKIVEKFLARRVQSKTNDLAQSTKGLNHLHHQSELVDDIDPFGDAAAIAQGQPVIYEYLVKYKCAPYAQCEWVVEKQIAGGKRINLMINRFNKKWTNNPLSIVYSAEEPFNPDYLQVDRIICRKEFEGEWYDLVKWNSLGYDDCTWENEAKLGDHKRVELYKKINTPPTAEEKKKRLVRRPATREYTEHVPVFKDNHSLRDYQVEGFNWLCFNWHNWRSCILADEMGLGKTIQSLSFLKYIREYKEFGGPFLIVAPLSTVPNWQREIEEWTDMNVIVYHGRQVSRGILIKHEFYYNNEGEGTPIPNLYKFDVVVTTYEMLTQNAGYNDLNTINWRAVVIDEAHRLKNTNCRLIEQLRKFSFDFKVLLTGTPLQNNVAELWSLLNFLDPEGFSNQESFLDEYGDLKTESQVNALQGILKPRMLRRLKEDVEKSIADKEETVIEVELTPIQKGYYRAILERNFSFLAKGTTKANVPNLMNTMMELRKCCNHPYLIKGAEDSIISEHVGNGELPGLMRTMIESSGKMVLLDKLLPRLHETGHRVLIFSQMVRVLDILEDYLSYRSYQYERIDGSIRGDLRQASIDRFCRPDSDRFVFLLCTRAGGVGINLTAADTVIIFDSDWNPQNDLQAQARCHRIGQEKPVKIYRLITRNSYEREMFDKASMKLGLDKAVLQNINRGGNDIGPQGFSKEEVEELLRRGAYGAIMDKEEDLSARFCEEDLDSILSRRTQVIKMDGSAPQEPGQKSSTFAKASFVSTGQTSGDIDINDPDFWRKWASKADVNQSDSAELVLDEPRMRKRTTRFGAVGMDDPEIDDELKAEFAMDDEFDDRPTNPNDGKVWNRNMSTRLMNKMIIWGWNRWEEIRHDAELDSRLSTYDVAHLCISFVNACLQVASGDPKWQAFGVQLHQSIRNYDPKLVSGVGRKTVSSLLNNHSNQRDIQTKATSHLTRLQLLWQLSEYGIGENGPLIMQNIFVKLQTPPIKELPTPWWGPEWDNALLTSIYKYGYDDDNKAKADPLVFGHLIKTWEAEHGGQTIEWPTRNDIVIRVRRLISMLRKRGEKTTRNPTTGTEVSGEPKTGSFRELRLAAQNTAWTTHELHDFFRVLLSYGEPVIDAKGLRVWKDFCGLSVSLHDKTDIELTLFLNDYLSACKRVVDDKRREREKARLLSKNNPALALSLSSPAPPPVFVAPTPAVTTGGARSRGGPAAKSRSTADSSRGETHKSEIIPGLFDMPTYEQAVRVLFRVQLMTKIRTVLVPYLHEYDLSVVAVPDPSLPSWWQVDTHDRDLILAVSRYGISRPDLHVTDVSLQFSTIAQQHGLPRSSLFQFQDLLEREQLSFGRLPLSAAGQPEAKTLLAQPFANLLPLVTTPADGSTDAPAAQPAIMTAMDTSTEQIIAAITNMHWPNETAIVNRLHLIVDGLLSHFPPDATGNSQRSADVRKAQTAVDAFCIGLPKTVNFHGVTSLDQRNARLPRNDRGDLVLPYRIRNDTTLLTLGYVGTDVLRLDNHFCPAGYEAMRVYPVDGINRLFLCKISFDVDLKFHVTSLAGANTITMTSSHPTDAWQKILQANIAPLTGWELFGLSHPAVAEAIRNKASGTLEGSKPLAFHGAGDGHASPRRPGPGRPPTAKPVLYESMDIRDDDEDDDDDDDE